MNMCTQNDNTQTIVLVTFQGLYNLNNISNERGHMKALHRNPSYLWPLQEMGQGTF
jgi:hypothetical protein